MRSPYATLVVPRLRLHDRNAELPRDREQYLNVAIFGTESDKQREVIVARKSRLAPADDGNAANETRSPLSHPNEVLQVCGLLNELVQRTNRPKSRCCSTSPE